ncbi:MAG: hypothetical protein ACTHM0_13330 [Sphingomonas sp.]
MSDLLWPDDLRPKTMSFYLQPHVGGAESPLTRTRKVYGLSGPRWIAKMTFTASWRGGTGTMARGPRLDALIADMEGGLNRVLLWDFRRPYPIGLRRYYAQFTGQRFPFSGGETFSLGERFVIPPEAEPTNLDAAAGASTMTFVGFKPGEAVFDIGDYLGGDGRPHIVRGAAVIADDAGVAVVSFRPPLSADVPAGTAVTMQPTAPFRITSEDAGDNASGSNGQASYSLEFTEDLG